MLLPKLLVQEARLKYGMGTMLTRVNTMLTAAGKPAIVPTTVEGPAAGGRGGRGGA